MTSSIKHQLIFIVLTILRIKGSESLRFSEPITVRLSFDSWPVEIYGLRVSPKKELYIMKQTDGHGYDDEQWEKVEVDTPEAELLIPAIFQRIKSLTKQAA